jgi:hypothetical protein
MRPNGTKIRLEAPAPLPDGLVALVRKHRVPLLAILTPSPPRHAGGFSLTDQAYPCPLCSGIEWQQHVTYRYCLTCGREDGPGGIVDNQKEPHAGLPMTPDTNASCPPADTPGQRYGKRNPIQGVAR